MDAIKESNEKKVKREVSTKKNHLISLFKNFEVTISDKKKKYFDKLQSLLSAWEHISTFVAESSSESPQPEFEALFLHTLRFILCADWRNVSKPSKTHLSLIIQRIITDVTNGKSFFSILPQCRVLESITNEGWNHPVLKKIFEDETIDIEELIEYFHLENGKVIVARLEILLESRCEDLAIRLSKACLMTFNLTDPLEMELNQHEVDYITDIYLCSLYRAKNTKDLIAELKMFELCDGLQLLQRYNKRGGVAVGYNDNCKEARIWKCSRKVMELISSTLLANAVLRDNFAPSDVDILQDLIREWACVHTTSLSDVFSPVPLEMIWKCVLIARCSMCIYPFCSFLIDCGAKQYDLNHLLRCLIRAINQNMNEIEQHRVHHNNEKLKFTHEMLSKGFLLTAELFREYRNIFKECLLTAFSLTPSREGLQKLEDFSKSDVVDDSVAPKMFVNATKIEIKTENIYVDLNDQTTTKNDNPDDNPPLPPDLMEPASNNQNPIPNEIEVILKSMGLDNEEEDEAVEIKTDLNTSSSSLNETIKGTAPAYITEVESMKIEDSIKTDLNSILRYQRHHTLTWDFEWSELKANCEKYYEMFEKRGYDEVELKYLDLDYNQFKNRPVDYEEYTGIEKGYEHFATSEVEASEDEYGYRRMVGYSSGDDSNYRDYGGKKRKKSRGDVDNDWCAKPSSKKKRSKPKVKIDGVDTPDEHSADSIPNGDAAVDEKPLSVRFPPSKRKQRIRLRGGKNLSDSEEANIDSQSENQPPEDEDDNEAGPESVGIDGSVKSPSNNLQLLRQFRITLTKPLSSEENTSNLARPLSSEENIHKVTTTTIHSADEIEKSVNRVFTDGERMQLKICIPKCDSLPYRNNIYLLESLNEKSLKKPEKLPISLSTITSTDDNEIAINNNNNNSSSISSNNNNNNNNNNSNNDNNSSCNINKNSNNTINSNINRTDAVSNSHSKDRSKPYPKLSKHSKRFAVNRNYRKKLFLANVRHEKETAENINDVINDIFPEFSSNGCWQMNGDFVENFPTPTPPPVPVQKPTQTLSEFLDITLDSTFGPTSSNEATFVSSSVELAPHALPIHTEVAATSITCNELTPLQPAGTPPMAQVLSSYLSSTIDSIDSVYSYPSNICHNQLLALRQSTLNDDLSEYEPPATELLDISASSSQHSMHNMAAESTYSSYSSYQQPPLDDVYSMSVSSSYDVSSAPSPDTVTTSTSSLLANGVPTPLHSNVGACSTPNNSSTKLSSKLRAALQKPCVTLYDIAYMNKKPTPQEGSNDREAVNQILDVYRDTIDKHPELSHVPARRKRSYDQGNGSGAPKRQRRAKKVAATQPPPTANFSILLTSTTTTNSPMPGVQVPSQKQPPNVSKDQQQMLLPNQMNTVYECPSAAVAAVGGGVGVGDAADAHKLPGCVTAADISSQNYGSGVGGLENAGTNNVVSAYETDGVGGQLINVNGFVDDGDCVPTSTPNPYWLDENTTLINLDATNMPSNCDDIKIPYLLATIYHDNTTETNNPAVCISIPEDQYTEADFGNCFPLVPGTDQLLQSNDTLYSKNQNDNAVVAGVQPIQYLDDSNVVKQEGVSLENGVIVNMDNLFYRNSNYPTEVNKYGT